FARDVVHGVARVQGGELVEYRPDHDDLPGLDVQVAGLTLDSLAPIEGLVHVVRGARQGEPLAFRPRHQHHGAKARGTADAYGRDGRPDILHRVVDGEARGDSAAGRVDVDRDLLLRVVSRP